MKKKINQIEIHSSFMFNLSCKNPLTTLHKQQNPFSHNLDGMDDATEEEKQLIKNYFLILKVKKTHKRREMEKYQTKITIMMIIIIF